MGGERRGGGWYKTLVFWIQNLPRQFLDVCHKNKVEK